MDHERDGSEPDHGDESTMVRLARIEGQARDRERNRTEQLERIFSELDANRVQAKEDRIVLEGKITEARVVLEGQIRALEAKTAWTKAHVISLVAAFLIPTGLAVWSLAHAMGSVPSRAEIEVLRGRADFEHRELFKEIGKLAGAIGIINLLKR